MGKSDSYINVRGGVRISKATGKPVKKYTKTAYRNARMNGPTVPEKRTYRSSGSPGNSKVAEPLYRGGDKRYYRFEGRQGHV